MFGAPKSGKSLLLGAMDSGEVMEHNPFVGFTVETVEFDSSILICFEINKSEEHYLAIKDFTPETTGTILLVNSEDKESVKNSFEFLGKLKNEGDFEKGNLVILVNHLKVGEDKIKEIEGEYERELNSLKLKFENVKIDKVGFTDPEDAKTSLEWLVEQIGEGYVNAERNDRYRDHMFDFVRRRGFARRRHVAYNERNEERRDPPILALPELHG